MEDAGWTLPPFLCCGCSGDAPGQEHPARMPLTRPPALTRRTRHELSGPTVPSPAPKGWLHPAGAGRIPDVRRGSSGLLQA